MRVLVTGATGYIGKEIVSELSDDNFEVFGIGNSNLKSDQQEKNFFQIDITKLEELAKLDELVQIDVVIHSAGLAHQFKKIEKQRFEQVNVEGTKNILNSAIRLKIKHFVLISSTAVYGIEKKVNGQVKVIDENSICQPETFYAESKLAAEKIAVEICTANNIDLTIFRLAPVIGEENAGNVARLIESIDRRRFIWIGNGENYKSLIYKRDVARACRKVLVNKMNKIEIFNLASDPVKMQDFVAAAAKFLGRNIPSISIPPKIVETVFAINRKIFKIAKIQNLSQTIEKWLSDDVYSAEKFKNEYNFRPQTDSIEALRKQVQWYKRKNNFLGE